MKHVVSFKATGHQNILSKHRTTLMTTVEPHLTLRGDCIIAVSAEMGLAQLPTHIKEAARQTETKITLSLQVNDKIFETTGKGDPGLDYTDPIDMVARKSTYTCGRTLMIECDKAAIDIPRDFVELLSDSNSVITVKLTYVTS